MTLRKFFFLQVLITFQMQNGKRFFINLEKKDANRTLNIARNLLFMFFKYTKGFKYFPGFEFSTIKRLENSFRGLL